MNSRLERVGSKDSWAHLLSALAEPGPGDLGVGDLRNSATPVSTVCFTSPQMDLFSKSPREWRIVPVNIYF